MKLIKKITAAVTAMAMAASMMSVGASAAMTAEKSVNVWFNSADPQHSHANHQENITINTRYQKIRLTQIAKSYNGAYVHAENSISSLLNVNCYSVLPNNQYDAEATVDLNALGTTATIKASFQNYQLGTYTGTVKFDA